MKMDIEHAFLNYFFPGRRKLLSRKTIKVKARARSDGH